MNYCSGRFPTSLRSRRVSLQLRIDHTTRDFIQNIQKSNDPIQSPNKSNS